MRRFVERCFLWWVYHQGGGDPDPWRGQEPGRCSSCSAIGPALSNLVHGSVHLLSAPGVIGSPESQRAFLEDAYVKEALARFPDVSIALVGIGSIDPSQLLSLSGNVFSPKELNQLRKQGAVGDILLRFFDAEGKPIKTSLDDRVIGMQLE